MFMAVAAKAIGIDAAVNQSRHIIPASRIRCNPEDICSDTHQGSEDDRKSDGCGS